MPLITERLRTEGIPFEIMFHQPAFHARDEAHRLGISLSVVVKTILIESKTGCALAVIPALRRLDMHRIRRALGEDARLATEAEILRRFPAFPLGALPPLSKELHIPICIDPEVAGQSTIVFATSESESVRVKTDEILAGARTRIVPLATRPWQWELDEVAEEVELRSTEEDEAEQAVPLSV